MKPFNKNAVNQHTKSLWRYADALPCTLEQAVTLGCAKALLWHGALY